jgi:hypothetical protein
VTSDAGLLLPRELNERLGLSTLIERHLSDPCTGRNAQFPLADLFRQSIYSRMAGYEDTNDAERLAEDPTFRMLASRERRNTSVALTSTSHWFETDALAEERNYHGLIRLNAELVQHPATRPRLRRVILDIDSSARPALRLQPRGRLPRREAAAGKRSQLRKRGAKSCSPLSLGIAGAVRRSWSERTPAFARPEIYEALERRGVRYAIRLPANDVLERQIEDLLTRPRGRPSHAPLVRYRSFHYQDELFRFRANEVRLLLGVIGYNLGNLLRRLVLPVAIQDWYFTLQLAESYLTGAPFRRILQRIERLGWHPT